MDLEKPVALFQLLILSKFNTEVTASKSSLTKISKHLDVLTQSEGLPNHYEAVRGRLE